MWNIIVLNFVCDIKWWGIEFRWAIQIVLWLIENLSNYQYLPKCKHIFKGPWIYFLDTISNHGSEVPFSFILKKTKAKIPLIFGVQINKEEWWRHFKEHLSSTGSCRPDADVQMWLSTGHGVWKQQKYAQKKIFQHPGQTLPRSVWFCPWNWTRATRVRPRSLSH